MHTNSYLERHSGAVISSFASPGLQEHANSMWSLHVLLVLAKVSQIQIFPTVKRHAC